MTCHPGETCEHLMLDHVFTGHGPKISRNDNPYRVEQTPRGSVVVCGEHLMTDEIKLGEAHALARALNMEHQTRMLLR